MVLVILAPQLSAGIDQQCLKPLMNKNTKKHVASVGLLLLCPLFSLKGLPVPGAQNKSMYKENPTHRRAYTSICI